MRRGEIRWVNLDPAVGSESAKRRPGVIVSNDGANEVAARLRRGVVTVVPLTSNVKRVYPFQVLLIAKECGLKRDSKAQAEQVRSVSVERIGDQIGAVPATVIEELDDALRIHLDL
ncbi:MAG: type II toxin-antitoxin system PemK/MazF family toxin [Actinomycetota bacterium]|nr:type II toxin-antitoxin system PemK/MazF family toxin [Actinomycetota bacterium]